MGEARRRRDLREEAYATGRPQPRPDRCPACSSRRIAFVPASATWSDPVEHGTCLDCRAIWEALPALYVADPVCAEPCDNCAFRPGSPEQVDPETWKALIAGLKRDPETGWFTGRFYCHKDVPIDQEQGPGNFLFPKRSAADEAPSDGAMVEDTGRMRVCSGFLRMFWTQQEKAGRLTPGATGRKG